MVKERIRLEVTKAGNPVVHGRPGSYNNHGCRCDECTEAWRKYLAEKGYVKTHRAKISKKRKGVSIKL